MRTVAHPADPAASPPDLWAEPEDRADLRARRGNSGLALVALALVCLGAALYWWRSQPIQVVQQVPATLAPARDDAPAAVPAPAPTGPRFPVAAPENGPIAADGVTRSLQALFGNRTVASLFLLDQFPRRLVATIDNLGREHAPAAMWPVQPPGDRFTVTNTDGTATIAPENARRYQPWVDVLAAVDARAAADWYRRMYPLLQQAYRDLGFGNRYFNDRIVEVIDLLLETPSPAGPLAVELTEVHGPVASLQPWTRYEFADPDLQSLTSGQKILLRLAPEQRKQVLAKLRELRAQIVSGR